MLTKNREISNSDDVIDSRDVIARIEELEGGRAAFVEAVEDAQENDVEDSRDVLAGARMALRDWDASEEAVELKVLQDLASEGESSPDWRYGETLIRDSYFCDYAEELAHDVCEMGKASDWPFRHIDWAAAADELKNDYSRIDFDGVDYWVRC